MRHIIRAVALFFVCLTLLLTNVVSSEGQTDVLRSTLSNGLRVVIVPNRLAPVATTMINYLAGSNETPDGFPGTAHALEHMMFRGSPALSSAQLATLLGAMGGRFNADTQQTVTQYFFTVPTDDLEVALKAESVRMQGVLSTEELWSRERGAIEQEIGQDLSNPMYLFHQKLIQNLFEGTPYAVDALGTKASFDKTTGADLRKFHDRWYAPNNAILVVTGDVEPHRTLSLIRELFEGIPSRPVPGRPAVQLKPLKAVTIEMETDLPYGLAIVAYRLPGYRSPDFAPAQVMADVLASERGDLFALVPEGKALAAGFVADFLPDAGLGYAYAAFPFEEDGRKLVATLKDIVSGVSKSGAAPDLCEAAKRAEVAQFEYGKNSVEGTASLWSQALAIEGRSSPEDDIEAIKKVSVAGVDRIIRKHLVNETAVVGILKPHPAGSATVSHVFRGKESFAPKEAKPVELPEWAEKALSPAAIPVSNLSPSVSVLPNGLRLIFLRQTVSPTVSLYGEVKNQEDLQTPKGKEGVADVLQALFPYGTATMDRIAFRKAVDDIAAEVSVGATFSLRVLSRNFERGVGLLASNLLKPALPKAAFEVAKQETLARVAGQLKSPEYLSLVEMLKALYPENDPALREPSPESVASITLEDVKGYYRSVFRPDLTFVVVIGDITEEEARRVVGDHFGKWEATGPKPDTDLPPVPPSKPSQRVVPDTGRVQDEVTLVETLGLTHNHPDYYPLQVGNRVLSGAFYATRLYRDLRETTGLVYSVSSGIQAGRTRSYFEVSFACDPDKVSKARALVERNLRDMRERPVSPSELRQAKTLLLKEIPLSESSVSGIGQKLLRLVLMGLPLDEPVRAAKRYQGTTAEEVREAYSRWVRPEDLAQVVRGPNPQ